MKKLLVFFVALLLCGSAYALNETASNGPQNITNCYMVGTTACTSGSVVVLQATSPTYPGKEVTGSVTAGQQIYGVVVDTRNLTAEDMRTGQWIRVQTYGYNSDILVDTLGGGGITTGDDLVCSGKALRGTTGHAGTTSNTIALEANAAEAANATVAGFMGW